MELSGGHTNDEIKERVRVNYATIAASFDPKGPMLNKLFQERIITQAQFDEISEVNKPVDRGTKLLQKLIQGANPKSWVCFREALVTDEDYKWMVAIIDDYTRDATMPPAQSLPPSPPTQQLRIQSEKQRETPEDEVDGDFDVVVKCCDAQFYNEHSKEAYLMHQENRGRAYIINVFNVVGMNARDGTNKDRDNLSKLFLQLGFCVKVYDDKDGLKAKDIQEKVNDIAQNKDLENDQCFVLCILSHGGMANGKDVIYGTDGKYVCSEELFKPLTDRNCRYLRNKPRLIFFQACRTPVKLAADADLDLKHFLIGYPTEEGDAAWRDPSAGSWYIQTLVRIFMEHSCKTEIREMMDMVRDKVKSVFKSQIQMAKFTTHFDKQFFFFPGIKKSRYFASLKTFTFPNVIFALIVLISAFLILYLR